MATSGSGCAAEFPTPRRRRAGPVNQTRQFAQRHLFQRAADGRIDPLPGAADAALPLDAAVTRCAAAFGDGDRALEDIEDLRGGDQFGTAGQTVSALRAER